MSPQQTLIYNFIKQNPGCRTVEIYAFLGVDSRRPEMNLRILREMEMIKAVQKPKYVTSNRYYIK